jgi:hypothetical protein
MMRTVYIPETLLDTSDQDDIESFVCIVARPDIKNQVMRASELADGIARKKSGKNYLKNFMKYTLENLMLVDHNAEFVQVQIFEVVYPD